MTTLDRLRALHQEVCFAWRRYSDPSVSEGEADILNIGFSLLESMAFASNDGRRFTDCFTDEMRYCMSNYLQRVHSQFDSDADIKITEVPHNE